MTAACAAGWMSTRPSRSAPGAVMIGRPWVWAMAGGGEPGLGDLLATFKRELEVAMALSGVTRIADINRSNIDAMPW